MTSTLTTGSYSYNSIYIYTILKKKDGVLLILGYTSLSFSLEDYGVIMYLLSYGYRRKTVSDIVFVINLIVIHSVCVFLSPECRLCLQIPYNILFCCFDMFTIVTETVPLVKKSFSWNFSSDWYYMILILPEWFYVFHLTIHSVYTKSFQFSCNLVFHNVINQTLLMLKLELSENRQYFSFHVPYFNYGILSQLSLSGVWWHCRRGQIRPGCDLHMEIFWLS